MDLLLWDCAAMELILDSTREEWRRWPYSVRGGCTCQVRGILNYFLGSRERVNACLNCTIGRVWLRAVLE